jgi:hypothetical protein
MPLAFRGERTMNQGQWLISAGMMPLLDTLLCLKFLGMFPGIILLTLVCLFFWAGAYFLPGRA